MKNKKFLMLFGILGLLEIGTVTALCISVSADEVDSEAESGVSYLTAEPIIIVENVVKEDTVIDFLEVEPAVENVRVVDIPDRGIDFKSYMDYRRLGKYSQKDLQDLAYTNEDGFRVVDDRYIVAVGTAVCEEVGTYITLVLENGTEIQAVVGDVKDDRHTDEFNIVTVANGCCSEFIIDTDVMENRILRSGNISNYSEDWKSKVVQIIVHEDNVFDE